MLQQLQGMIFFFENSYFTLKEKKIQNYYPKQKITVKAVFFK